VIGFISSISPHELAEPVAALSEPLERWMDEPPPGLVLVEKDEPPTESNKPSDSDSRRSAADRKNSSRPKPDRRLRRSAAHRKPKTSLFGTDSLQSSALGIHDLWLIWF